MSAVPPIAARTGGQRDLWFAGGMMAILAVFFLPLPPVLIDFGLAVSMAFSVLILMVALWIQRPLEFSAFPTVLLIATLLRLALNLATTRVILTHGAEGTHAAGAMIGGFAQLVMGGDFIIGLIVFVILVTVNFLVITKGATRIAEVGARFTLDAIPGKQMAIDADVAAGTIDEKEAQRRRHELEEESAFFGAMDGASKFVRGDAIAGIIILCVNIFGGILIGVLRHGLPLAQAADVFVKLSVGDGLVTQIPALIVSLAAGLLVSKGGARVSADEAIALQLGHYPRALLASAGLLLALGLLPGLPLLPFAVLAAAMASTAFIVPRRRAAAMAQQESELRVKADEESEAKRLSVAGQLKGEQIELALGRQLAAAMISHHGELGHRIAQMRRRFARQYGIVVPEVRLSDSLDIEPRSYEIRILDVAVARFILQPGDILAMPGELELPVSATILREPAFGMHAAWVPATLAGELERRGIAHADPMSVMLTHLAETVRNHLSALLSYKDLRRLADQLDPEYRRLVDDICPAHISWPGLLAVLRLLLAERVSIRRLDLVMEAIAEAAPFLRRHEAIAEHVRLRLAAQLCADQAEAGILKVVRLGAKWEQAFQTALKREAKSEQPVFDMDGAVLDAFTAEAGALIRRLLDQGHQFALVTSPDVRSTVRLVLERAFPALPVLSQLEITRSVELRLIGSLA